MEKDYQKWHKIKKLVNDRLGRPYFYEREIWWCSMGANVGFEQDGKGKNFSRPILIIKKFNKEVFLGLPLTTKPKIGKYYLTLDLNDEINRKVILSQLRLFDSKRLQEKIITIDLSQFLAIKKAIIQLFE